MQKDSKNYRLLLVVIFSMVSILLSFCFNHPRLYATSSTTTLTGDVITTEEDGRLTFKSTTNTAETDEKTMNQIIVKYRFFISGVAAIGAISMLLFFITHFCKLAATATNSRERSDVIVGLIWSAIATAGLGSVAVVVGFFYRIFL